MSRVRWCCYVISRTHCPCVTPTIHRALFQNIPIGLDSVPTACNSDYGAYLTQQTSLPIVLDTGASTSLSPVLSDFVTPLEPTDISEIQGLCSKSRVVGKGMVEWTILDYWNVVRVVRTHAYYVPDVSIRLFSPQSYFQENKDMGSCVIRCRNVTLTLPDGARLEFPYHPSSNLPLMLQGQAPVAGAHFSDAKFLSDDLMYHGLMTVVDQTNQNLQPAQKELLLWHQKLCHAGLQWCQRLCQPQRDDSVNHILKTKSPAVSTCSAPMCGAACQLAKQKRRNPPRRPSGNLQPMHLRQGHLHPDDRVSIDQYISGRLPGRLPHTHGKEKKSARYNGGTIFVDHATSLMYLQHQVALTAGETNRAKKKFEQFASLYGVRIRSYRADNVPFASREFLVNLELNQQTIDFSGVGAHHQNGVAERSIQTVTGWARVMVLLHAVLMWPDTADLSLC